MRKLIYQTHSYDCLENETVLETLLRHTIDIPYSCGVGVCQSCLLKTSSSNIPKQAQLGLKKSLIQQNYFLPCVCKPKHNFEIIQNHDNEIFIDTIVLDKQWLSKDVCQILLQKPINLQFHPGQSINIRNKHAVTRSYSIANNVRSNTIELHVKHLQNGQMSQWLCQELKIGDSIELQGANGGSYYDSHNTNQNMLLIGTGTGLAPLVGIVRDALENHHQGEIHIYHGSRYSEGLYLVETLRKLESQHANIHYYPCLSSTDTLLHEHKNIANYTNQRADDYALKNHISLKNWKVFLSGHPIMVKKIKTKAYIAGATLNDIHIDPFELKDLRNKTR